MFYTNDEKNIKRQIQEMGTSQQLYYLCFRATAIEKGKMHIVISAFNFSFEL